ncbi:hypothetical protein JW964_28030 [candidate division KSB1 bacterium]|nr:hypothetical protein [candidate division KSB1 bacterium]
MRVFRLIIIIFIITNFLKLELLAEEGYGGYAGAFLRMGLGARPKALGGAYTAVAEGSYAGYYNPGAFPRNDYKELTLSYSALSLDRNFNYIGLVIPITPRTGSGEKPLKAGVHLGWINAGVDNIDGRDSNGRHYATFSNSENAFTFGFAVQPHELISVGFCAKILYNRMPEITKENEALTSKGLGFDVGVLIHPIQPLTVGILVKDLRSKYTWNTESVYERGTTTYNNFLQVLRIGAAYRLLQDRLLLTTDFEDNKKQEPKLHFGVEFSPYSNIYLRAGMDHLKPAFGFGYLYKLWKFQTVLDYAYISDEVAPSGEHVISWSFRL